MIRFELSLTKNQIRLVQRLANKRRVTMSDVIRQLILDEAIRQGCATARRTGNNDGRATAT
jgi:Ribbon-helix-helix protein, copG family